MSKTIDDGGPAFPFREQDGDGSPYMTSPGMTLRDYFAAAAMQGMCVNPPDGIGERLSKMIAVWAYEQADAMLAAREPKEESK